MEEKTRKNPRVGSLSSWVGTSVSVHPVDIRKLPWCKGIPDYTDTESRVGLWKDPYGTMSQTDQ